MRTATTQETRALSAAARRTELRVFIEDGDGVDQNLSDFFGKDWVAGLIVDSDVDQDIDTCKLSLVSQHEKLSLSYLNETSRLNLNNAGSYDPMLGLNRFVQVDSRILPDGGTGPTMPWSTLFEGRIKRNQWDKSPIRIDAQDLGGILLDRFIEGKTERYGSSGGIQSEVVIQDIFDDWAPGATLSIVAGHTYVADGGDGNSQITGLSTYITDGFERGTEVTISGTVSNDGTYRIQKVEASALTLKGVVLTNEGPVSSTIQGHVVIFSATGTTADPFKVSESSLWAIKEYHQRQEPIMSAIHRISDQRAWALKYRWNDSVGAFVLTYFEPGRAKSSADLGIGKDRYLDVRNLEVDLSSIRNACQLEYSNDGDPDDRRTEEASDATSITDNGRRWMQVPEPATGNISTSAEALRMAEGIVADLKDPKAPMELDILHDWRVQNGDLIQVEADGRRFTSNQDVAVVTTRQSFSTASSGGGVTAKAARTTIGLRQGKPVSRVNVWLRDYFASPGRNPMVDLDGPDAVIATAVPAGGGVVIRVPYPLQKDFAEYELHMSETPGFTPAPSTLEARGRARTLYLKNLRPGRTKYFRVVTIDRSRNQVASPAAAISEIVGWAGAGLLNPDIQWAGSGFQYGGFDVHNPPLIAADDPPDGWEMVTGVWGTDAQVSTSPTPRSGDSILELVDTATATKVRALYMPVRGDHFLRLATVFRSPSATVQITVEIEWYTDKGSTVGTTGKILNADVVDTVDTWERAFGIFQAPATARWARVIISKDTTAAAVYFDRIELEEGLPAFEGFDAAGTGIVAGGTWTKVPLEQETYDYGSNFDPTTNKRFDCPVRSLWKFQGQNKLLSTSGPLLWGGVGIRKNGSTWLVRQTVDSGNAYESLGHMVVSAETGTVLLDVGDYIELFFNGDSANVKTTGTTAEDSFLRGQLIEYVEDP